MSHLIILPTHSELTSVDVRSFTGHNATILEGGPSEGALDKTFCSDHNIDVLIIFQTFMGAYFVRNYGSRGIGDGPTIVPSKIGLRTDVFIEETGDCAEYVGARALAPAVTTVPELYQQWRRFFLEAVSVVGGAKPISFGFRGSTGPQLSEHGIPAERALHTIIAAHESARLEYM